LLKASFALTSGASSFGFNVGPAAVIGLFTTGYDYESLDSSLESIGAAEVPHFAFAFSRIGLTACYTAVFKSLATLEKGSNPV